MDQTTVSSIVVQNEQGINKGYGLVEFKAEPEQVKEIKSELDWLSLDEQILHADFVEETYQTWEGLQSRCLFVNSMPETFLDVSNLRETFRVVTSPVYCQDAKQQKVNSLLPDPLSVKPVIAGNPIVISLSRFNPKSMDIKPRSQEGVLLSVHGNGSDFVVLQLTDGAIIFTADNGAGPITTRYAAQSQNSLCDGQWHSVRAVKSKHTLLLTVDNIIVEPQHGKAEISAADTNDPLYIGGVADALAKGIVANGEFVGCIRNLRLNNAQQYIATGTPMGDVRLDSCPPK